MINEIPKELKDGKEEVRNLFDTILEKLTNHVSLKNLSKEYGEIITIIEKIEKVIKNDNNKDKCISYLDNL